MLWAKRLHAFLPMLLALNATCVITCYKISKGECRFYLEDGTYDAQSLCIKKYCYCFPEQVKVDKPCPEVQYSDYKQLMGVACLETIPNGTRTPEITPDSTPQLTPYQTPDLTPQQTPELTPYQTPYQSPFQTPYQTPNFTPNSSVPKTEEPTISFKIIVEQHNQVYIYTTIGFFAVLFITVLIVVICCCHKKKARSKFRTVNKFSRSSCDTPNTRLPYYNHARGLSDRLRPFPRRFPSVGFLFWSTRKRNIRWIKLGLF